MKSFKLAKPYLGVAWNNSAEDAICASEQNKSQQNTVP